ncbi:MAG: signal peptidase I [archaeon]
MPKRDPREEKPPKGRKEGFVDLGPLLAELRDWIVWIGFAVILSFIVGNILNFALGNTVPLVAIMSGSMTHGSDVPQTHYGYLQAQGFSREQIDGFPISGGFRKGDVIVVKGREKKYKIGDVIVFNVPNASYPIIHRVIGTSEDSLGKVYYRTKGDHNPSEDRWLIPHGEVKGKAIFVIPFLGYIKVVPTELCISTSLCRPLFDPGRQ